MTIEISQFPHRYLFVLFFLGLFFVTGAAQTTSPPADTKSRDLANVGFNHADRPPGDITKVPSAGKSLPVTTAVDDLLIFGPPIEGRPNAYAFNARYEVLVEKKDDGRILSIFLARSDNAPPFTKLTEAEMRDFYRKVKVFGDIGKPLFTPQSAGRYYSYIYENGKIDKFFITKDGDEDRVYTSQIIVSFPYKIHGQISEMVDSESPVTTIKMGKCYYYCFTRGVRSGDTGDFFVIGPSNGFNGQCYELNL